jgi:hypothetical protein
MPFMALVHSIRPSGVTKSINFFIINIPSHDHLKHHEKNAFFRENAL